MKLQADEEALDHIATMANGDIRRALNALELGAMTTRLMQAARSILRWMWPRNRYASRSSRRTSPRSMTCCPPFIKAFGVPAMRHCSGSCMRSKAGDGPDGVHPPLDCASEDIGLANPQAMVQAVSALDAYRNNGWPEAKLNIAQAILFAVESQNPMAL